MHTETNAPPSSGRGISLVAHFGKLADRSIDP
jgi:hypothetical protein